MIIHIELSKTPIKTIAVINFDYSLAESKGLQQIEI